MAPLHARSYEPLISGSAKSGLSALAGEFLSFSLGFNRVIMSRFDGRTVSTVSDFLPGRKTVETVLGIRTCADHPVETG